MQLSAIILSWNSDLQLDRCLSSLLLSLAEDFNEYEIFVVDNGSEDKSTAIIEKYTHDNPAIIKPIFLEKNTGTTYSRNLALKQATGDYILILDSDVFLSPGIFRFLQKKLDESPKIGLVVPRLVYPDGHFQKSTDNFPTLFSKLKRYLFLKNIEQKEEKISNIIDQTVDYAISAFWLLKKEIIKQVGLLDENIFYAPEDVDYCLRIWQHGYKIIYIPSCEAIHDAQEISKGFRLNKAFFSHLKGLFYYFIKHRYFIRKPLF